MVVIGDFNAKSKHWCSQDSTNFKDITIENVTSQLGLSQIIMEATHILESSSSCIDFIFTTQPNLVVKFGHRLMNKTIVNSISHCVSQKTMFHQFHDSNKNL